MTSSDRLTAWQWWKQEENQEDIIQFPNVDGGLACYLNTRDEIVILQHDDRMDDNCMIVVNRHLVRPLIERMCELLPELTEAPKPPLVIQPPRQLAIAGPNSRRPVDMPLPLGGAAAE